MRYQVRDNGSILQFDGILLAESSSRTNNPRWVDFELYKTNSGTYVLSRVGRSMLFHSKDCKTVSRNNLKRAEESELSADALPCEECLPERTQPEGVYPETHRYYALRTTTAKGVLAGLMQYDENNSEYLTNVAKKLLISAAEVDDAIDEVFSRRVID